MLQVLGLCADDRLGHDVGAQPRILGVAVALSRDDILVVRLRGELAECLVGSQASPGTGSNQIG